MARQRTWSMSVQYGQYMMTLYELKWWHKYPEMVGWVCLELGARIRHEWLSEKISTLGQKAYQKADEAEIVMLNMNMTKEQARELHSDFVDIFEDEDDGV